MLFSTNYADKQDKATKATVTSRDNRRQPHSTRSTAVNGKQSPAEHLPIPLGHNKTVFFKTVKRLVRVGQSSRDHRCRLVANVRVDGRPAICRSITKHSACVRYRSPMW
uniref:Uncharacterized protein n=1 Tax=Sipha flava TaxID=143950 RepID=A0A2S2QRW4_9HEMI